MRKDVELRICAVFCRIYLCDRSIHRSIYFGGRGKMDVKGDFGGKIRRNIVFLCFA